MSELQKYISVIDLIDRMQDPVTAENQILRLGQAGRLNFYICLENVYVLWFAVFGDKHDLCGYHQTKEKEPFQITTESFRWIIAASKGKVTSNPMIQLEIPSDVKKRYGLTPDRFTYKLRKNPRTKKPGQNAADTRNKQSNLDIFRKLKKQEETNDFFPELDRDGWEDYELDNDCWESLSDDELVILVGDCSIFSLLVPETQAVKLFKKKDQTPSETEKPYIIKYAGQREIVDAFKAHGRSVCMRQIRNYFDDGLAVTYTLKGKKKIPNVTNVAIAEFLYDRFKK